ncbi:Ribonuclease H [Gracilaria domingensis]|nr:Ribonuclease H [Gracilaria domingensis]
MELLFKRAGKWQTWMKKYVTELIQNCEVCIRSGEPEQSGKFSLSRLDQDFNTRVYFDIMYWKNRMALHAVDAATEYSEISAISSRDSNVVLRCLDTSWCLRHGDPVEMVADREFNKKLIHEHMNKQGIKFLPLPSRTHNKAGTVESKNRVLKDILERFELDDVQISKRFQEKLSNAGYIGNIMYGNCVASLFEFVRGYNPSLNDTGQLFVSEEYLEAYRAMPGRGILARILRSRPKHIRGDIAVGEMVLVLVSNGVRKRDNWKEERVLELRPDGSAVVGQGRQQKVIAREDIRKLPSNKLAENFVRAQCEIPAKRHQKSEVHYMEEDVDSDTTEANSDMTPTSYQQVALKFSLQRWKKGTKKLLCSLQSSNRQRNL